ncbi:MAG TPA: hypothetical protein VJI46_06155 [Candidatus Nanoarchaeia archaeon]|nr:hypothetical protein [Candidatus Nanoarchaeia archaeon]
MKDIGGILKRIEGKQTADTIAKSLGIKQESALNLIARLKKQGFVATEGGGRQKRIYSISTRRIPAENGMFAVINRHAKAKVVPEFIHTVHGRYGPEGAIIDAIKLGDIRVLQGSLYLFNHIKDWTRLHALARKHNVEAILGALYDLTRKVIKARKMPIKMRKALLVKRPKKLIELIRGLRTDSKWIGEISAEWGVKLPFSARDVEEMK